MTGSIPPGSNHTSTAKCGSPGEVLPPGSSRIGLVALTPTWQFAMNSWIIWLTYAGCSQVMQCSTSVAAQGEWLCRSPAT